MKVTSIKQRLVAGLMLIVLFFIVQASLVAWVAEVIKKDVVDTVRKNTLAAAQLTELAVLAQQIRRYEKEYFVYVDSAVRRATYEKEWTVTATKIAETLEKMKSNKGNVFQSRDIDQVRTWWAAADFYSSEMRKVFASVAVQADLVAVDATAVATGLPVVDLALVPKPAVKRVMYSPGEVNEMIKAGKDRFSNELIKGVAALQAEKTKTTLALADLANTGFQTMVLGVAGTALVGIVIALVLVLKLPKSILAPVRALTEAVQKISLGQTTTPVTSIGVREFQGLAKALERMRLAQDVMVNRLRSRPAAAQAPSRENA